MMQGMMQVRTRNTTSLHTTTHSQTQIENELSGPSNTPYVEWLGQLVTQLKAGLPWVMCHGAHANDTIETCNGCTCSGNIPGLQAQNQVRVRIMIL